MRPRRAKPLSAEETLKRVMEFPARAEKMIAELRAAREAKDMNIGQSRYPKEEIARRGKELYENRIRAQVEAGNLRKIVAIDIETGEFEVADDILPAAQALRQRLPDSQIWLVRVGSEGVHRFGWRMVKSA